MSEVDPAPPPALPPSNTSTDMSGLRAARLEVARAKAALCIEESSSAEPGSAELSRRALTFARQHPLAVGGGMLAAVMLTSRLKLLRFAGPALMFARSPMARSLVTGAATRLMDKMNGPGQPSSHTHPRRR